MANTLNIHQFEHKNELISAVAKELLEEINRYVDDYGDARLLLSGGSTPGPIYKALDQQLTKDQQLILGLVDERYVPFESEFSNERLIKECFPNVLEQSGELKGMVYNTNDEAENILQVISAYQVFFERTDIAIIGMGEDGHFASIFPNDPASETALSETGNSIRATRAPNVPKERITWDINPLSDTNSIYLIITGEKKLTLLLDSSLNLPIHQFLSANPNIKIYFSK